MALLEKGGNQARIGTKETGFDFWFRSLTVGEYSGLKTNALWDEGNPARIDFVELANIAVTKIEGFPEPYQDIHSIGDLLNLSINVDDEHAAFIAEAAWAMGWKIWGDINGISKKKSSQAITPESTVTSSIGRRKLSRLFRALHPR